jgi:GAF domain-containing protein
MKEAPIPNNEFERIAAVYKLNLLDTSPEEKFDRLTKAATQIFHVPISTLTIIDTNREWFKSCQGLSATEGERAISFCGHALVEDEILVIPDTLQDERFSDNPMVVNSPHIRFYAGVPIMSSDNKRIGVFCIKDTKPRQFSKHDEEILEGLAAWAELEINLRVKNLSESERQMILNKYKWKQDKIFISKHTT